MTTTSKATRRPPIHMIDTEADALTDLAIAKEDDLPQVSEMLLNEIRARHHPQGRRAFRPTVVTMRSTVDVRRTRTAARRGPCSSSTRATPISPRAASRS